MALTRGLLKELGLEQDSIDRVMEAHGASMSAMVSRSERDDAIKNAVEKAQDEWKKAQPEPIKPTETAEYKELLGKYNGLQTDLKLSEYKVKAKYRDFVKSKINLDDFEKSMESIKTEYAEFFDEIQPNPEPKPEQKPSPQFSADDKSKGGNISDEEKIAKEFAKAFA